MRYKKNKWYEFCHQKGYRQALPPQKKYVLVSDGHGICVGWLRYAAGDKSSPVFITPMMERVEFKKLAYCEILKWNDCLSDDFKWINVIQPKERKKYERT